MDTTLIAAPAAPRFPLRTTAALSVVALIGLLFVVREALPYFKLTEFSSGAIGLTVRGCSCTSRRASLPCWRGRCSCGSGSQTGASKPHRRLGLVYIGSVGSSAAAGYYLAFNTTFGWVFGAGLASLATAWIVTTGLAVRRGPAPSVRAAQGVDDPELRGDHRVRNVPPVVRGPGTDGDRHRRRTAHRDVVGVLGSSTRDYRGNSSRPQDLPRTSSLSQLTLIVRGPHRRGPWANRGSRPTT